MFASMILLISIFLPLNSCTRYLEEDSFQNMAPQDRPPKVMRATENDKGNIVEKEYYEFKTTTYVLSKNGWTYAFSMIWPIIILFLAKLYHKIKKVTWSIEPILAILAAGYIFYGSMFGPEIGAFLSFFANILFLLLWIIEACLLMYAKFRYKNLTTAFTQTGVPLPLHTGW